MEATAVGEHRFLGFRSLGQVVTRYGYWWGENSEGCETRRLGRRPGSL